MSRSSGSHKRRTHMPTLHVRRGAHEESLRNEYDFNNENVFTENLNNKKRRFLSMIITTQKKMQMRFGDGFFFLL